LYTSFKGVLQYQINRKNTGKPPYGPAMVNGIIYGFPPMAF
jgi:hypothetical protein